VRKISKKKERKKEREREILKWLDVILILIGWVEELII
jgi:hypothetical protein